MTELLMQPDACQPYLADRRYGAGGATCFQGIRAPAIQAGTVVTIEGLGNPASGGHGGEGAEPPARSARAAHEQEDGGRA
jgi:hypothetical protein